jgi:hypothetical protein
LTVARDSNANRLDLIEKFEPVPVINVHDNFRAQKEFLLRRFVPMLRQPWRILGNDLATEMSILTASRQSFDRARLLMANFPQLVSFQNKSDPKNPDAYGAINYSNTSPEWRVINFVNCLHGVHYSGALFEDMDQVINILNNQWLILK